MKIMTYQYPKSSFLSIEKDMGTIINQMLKNNRLKKLLYYTTRDCLTKPNLNEEESLTLLSDQYIRMVPKLYVDKDVLNYIIISFDNFIPNMTNPEFRDNVISFDILCHFDQWQMNDFQLRPYKIAAEIDTLFNNRHLSGIGELQFLGANQLLLNDEFAGLTLMYSAVHGEDDKINSPNQKD
jgi:hypothetical protein